MSAKKKNEQPEVNQPANEMFDDISGVAIVSTGVKHVPVKEEFEKAEDFATGHAPADEPKIETMGDIFDRFSHIKYVIDISSSMGEGMKSEADLTQFVWSEENLTSLRNALVLSEAEDEAGYNEDGTEFDDEDDEDFPEDEEEDVSFADVSDDDIKRHAIRYGATDYSGVLRILGIEFPPARKRSYGRVNESKMQTLKKAAKQFVEERFRRFADAKVGVMQFDDYSEQLAPAGASMDQVLAAIASLPDFGRGGTNIYKAVAEAVADCKRRPSEVNAHHIILVSDGCDRGAMQLDQMVPRMKELGIVFDFIFVQGLQGDTEGAMVAAVLKRVCEMTGGEYTEIRTREDFEQKFLAVSNRPMLPPARS